MSVAFPFRRNRQPTDQYVILQNKEEFWQRFFTSIGIGDEDRDEDRIVRLFDGTIAYNILGYAESIEDAQRQLFGRVFP